MREYVVRAFAFPVETIETTTFANAANLYANKYNLPDNTAVSVRLNQIEQIVYVVRVPL